MAFHLVNAYFFLLLSKKEKKKYFQSKFRKVSPSMSSTRQSYLPPAPPPLHPVSTPMNVPISSTGLPMLSHHQSRSFESSEQSSMSEKHGRGKAKTIFQKTTCELLTEKSVTTFGKPRIIRQQQVHEQQQSNQQHVPSTPQNVPSSQQQQPRGLPRYKHAADREMEAHLYTRYDNGNGRIREEGKRPMPHPRDVLSPLGEIKESEDYLDKQASRRDFMTLEENSRLVEQFRRSTTKNGLTDVSKPLHIDSETQKKKILSSPEENGYNKPVVILPTKTQPEVQKPRLIDFATYKREVQELQRRVAKVDRKEAFEGEIPLPPPMSPAIVIPKKQQQINEKVTTPILQPIKDTEPSMETRIR